MHDNRLVATAYSAEGVDVTLIDWMRSLTPSERLDVLQGFVDSAWELADDRKEGGPFPQGALNVLGWTTARRELSRPG